MMWVIATFVLAASAVGFLGAVRRPGGSVTGDPLAIASALIPPAAEGWLEAMRAESAAIADPRERRQFVRGCSKAIVFGRLPRDRMTTATQSVVAVAITIAIGLAVFGLLRYPGLRSGWWAADVAVFLVALGVHGALGGRLALLGSPRARRIGLLAALPAAGMAAAAAESSGAVSYTLALAVLALPAVAGSTAARLERRVGSGVVAAGTACVLASLLTFIAFVSVTYIENGGAPTPTLLAQFHHSGVRDYATWAVGDNLGGAVFMLGFVLLLGASLGMGAASVAPPRVSSTRRARG